MPAKAHVFNDRMPSPAEIENANELRKILASQIRPNRPARFKLAVDRDNLAEVVLTPALARSFLELLRYVGSGSAVTIVPTEQQLTTQQAADLLNVSRPHLIKLLEQEQLDYIMVGRHRRILAQDVFAYKKKRDGERAKALTELAERDADLI